MTCDPFIYVSPFPNPGQGERALDLGRILRARQDKTTKSPITNCYIGTAYQTHTRHV